MLDIFKNPWKCVNNEAVHAFHLGGEEMGFLAMFLSLQVSSNFTMYRDCVDKY